MDSVHIAVSPDVMSVERHCPHGHGPLTEVTHISGKRSFLLLTHGADGEAIDSASHIGPFLWFLCARCGYTELVDSDPNATLTNMGTASNG